MHPDAARCLAVWEEARSKEMLYEVEVRYRSGEGIYRWMIARGLPIRNEEGTVIAWYGTSTDIHDQKMLAEHLEFRMEVAQLPVVPGDSRQFQQLFQNLIGNAVKYASNRHLQPEDACTLFHLLRVTGQWYRLCT